MKIPIIILFTLIAHTIAGQNPIPIEISRNGHIMVKARINGIEGNFIFDTGAGLHVVSKKFFDKIRSHAADSSFYTAFRHTGERLDGPIYQFKDISLGSLLQHDPWVGVYAPFDEMGFDGLISCKLIEKYLVTVDVRSKQLIIETKESLQRKNKITIPLLVHSDRDRALDFFINVKLNDHYGAIMEFDTGAGYSPVYVHSRYMKYANIDTTALEIRNSGTGFGKTEKTYFDKTKKIRLSVDGTDETGFPNMIFKPSLIYDGLTSYIIFGDKSWTVDLMNRSLYLLE